MRVSVSERERHKARQRTGIALPHVSEDLDVGRDLLLRAVDAALSEKVDEELVAPSRAAAGEVCPGRGPVLVEPLQKDVLCLLRPHLRRPVLEHLAVTSLRERLLAHRCSVHREGNPLARSVCQYSAPSTRRSAYIYEAYHPIIKYQIRQLFPFSTFLYLYIIYYMQNGGRSQN